MFINYVIIISCQISPNLSLKLLILPERTIDHGYSILIIEIHLAAQGLGDTIKGEK